MNYLLPEKLNLHLKLGREVLQFVRIGEYFESLTFEYISINKDGELYSAKLNQALDYMYGECPDIDEFETVEELEGECEFMFSGSLEDCLEWSKNEYNCSDLKWALDINEIYNGYVDSEVLGQGREYE